MTTYALINNCKVENIIEWDGVPYTPAVNAVFDSDGNSVTPAVPAFGWSPPDGVTAAEVKDGDIPHIGLGYDPASGFEQPAVPVIPPPSAEQILAANTAMRDQLLSTASVALSPLQMAVSLGEATDAETASAKAWVAYSRAVNAIDLTQSAPQWPTAPANS